jgi:structural maintenance of chromosome 1
MKAMDRYVFLMNFFFCHADGSLRRLDDVESKLVDTEKEAEKARKDSKSARDAFNDVKQRRYGHVPSQTSFEVQRSPHSTELFNKAYNHISERIDQVYKNLTKGKAAPMGGVAYLSLEDNEVRAGRCMCACLFPVSSCFLLLTQEPYAGGIKYHAMPPMKRFRDMEQLSGGEKTVAALALLFAIHRYRTLVYLSRFFLVSDIQACAPVLRSALRSYQPSPFFVLDEVDAALDNTNVAKVANYIRANASEAFQFIIISLKGSLYERGNSLVGIYRDQDLNSSRTLTLDVSAFLSLLQDSY